MCSIMAFMLLMVITVQAQDQEQTKTSGFKIKQGEEITGVSKWISGLKEKSIKALDKKYEKMEKRLTRQTENYLKQLQKKENSIQKKLQQTDSVKAKEYLKNTNQLYSQLQNKIQQPVTKVQSLKTYFPVLDSVQSATQYINKWGSQLKDFSPDKLAALQSLQGTVSRLQGQMQNATDIKTIVRERKEQLKQQLDKTFNKEMEAFNKEAYYYQAQVDEYRNMLKDPDKLAARLISVANNIPLFKDFMSRNSWLSQLFPMPQNASNNPSQVLAGLQTRTQVQQMIGQQMGAASGAQVNPQQLIQQQMGGAQSQLNQLKDKVNSLGGSSSDIAMPDFKPNSQKTKSFLKRLEYGLNIQSQKTNYLLPATTDITLTAGYKLNDKSVIGLGAGYKLGWGKPWNEIRMSSQGINLRAYTDIKLKGSIWITGGYEKNYLEAFSGIPMWEDHKWQTSGLIGITKKVKIGKKTSNMQLLWDFLSYSQTPKGEAIKFRIGYTF